MEQTSKQKRVKAALAQDFEAVASSSGVSGNSHKPVIDCRGINFHFGTGELRKQILFDVNLSIQPGEIVLLTGPSGSGKTTLLTLIAGLRSMQEGRLDVLGYPLDEANQRDLLEVRRKIGFIFQAHNLLPYLTALQNVQMMLDLQPEVSSADGHHKAVHMLTLVGLGERLHYQVSQLSGGQRQRVAVARALVGGPELVLADEPTAALDGTSGREVVNLLQALAREKQTPILMVTHDARVLDIADRIIEMQDGRLSNDSSVEKTLHTGSRMSVSQIENGPAVTQHQEQKADHD